MGSSAQGPLLWIARPYAARGDDSRERRRLASRRTPRSWTQHEASTLAAHRCYLDKGFIPTFGERPMGRILPTEIQHCTPLEEGLSAVSVRKYHTMLHSVFERAPRDQVVAVSPCAHTELPKSSGRRCRCCG